MSTICCSAGLSRSRSDRRPISVQPVSFSQDPPHSKGGHKFSEQGRRALPGRSEMQRRMIWMLVSVVVLGVAILAAPGSAYAQSGSQYLVTKVDFPFKANGQSFEPGSYRVERRADMPTLMIQAVGGKASGAVPIVTRLAKRDGGSKDS